MCITRQNLFNEGAARGRIVRFVEGDSGSALLVVLVILAVLTLIGHIASRSSTTEVQIAGNDRLYKETYYAADGATELAAELLEQNVACPKGFTTAIRGDEEDDYVDIKVETLNFWLNPADDAVMPYDPDRPDVTPDRDFHLPEGYSIGEPHTNFTIGGRTRYAHGAAIQMAAGYEGKGKAASASGALLLYDIYTQRLGKLTSEAVCRTEWRHVIGSEGECKP